MSFRTLKLELISFVPELNAIQAGLRLNRAYKHLLDMHPWSFLKAEALLTTVAPYTTGTVALTQGSTTVTGTSTVWTTGMAGRWFTRSAEDTMILISSVDALAQTLTLNTAWAYDDVTAGGYSIVQHRFSKPTDCANILGIRLGSNFARVTKHFLDTLDPTRSSTGEPIYWLDIEDDVVELWPVPDAVYMPRVWYNKIIPEMSAESDTCLIPERVVLSYARLSSYLQLASQPERGAHYMQLVQFAQAEFAQLWQSALEEDMRRMSLPNRVLVDGVDFPMSNEYWYTHDVLDPRG